MSEEKKKTEDVTITINGETISISKGVHKVTELKSLGNIAQADDLEELKNGKLHLLADNASTNIKGDEVFVSHPKDSASS
ncbi:MAG TPA: hypothetical protein VE912_25010 [Bacteroidales bacterium]|nr:hypothetical protein [Bacteroidales bacterium]